MATPDKPSQSSSNGSKNGSGNNTVAFIVIAAIVILAAQYFLTGTNFALIFGRSSLPPSFPRPRSPNSRRPSIKSTRTPRRTHRVDFKPRKTSKMP